MSSVLIITRDFTPFCPQTGWMMRAVTMANFLAANGHDVTVIAALRSQQSESLNLNPGVHVEYVFDSLEYYKYEKKKWLLLFSEVLGTGLFRFLRLMRSETFDRTMISINSYKKRIQRTLDLKEFQNVIITTPPHSLQTLIPWIRKINPDATLISDLRDGWSIRPMYGRKKRIRKRIETWERTIFTIADHVSVVSNGMRDTYKRLYPKGNFTSIENGYSEVSISEPDGNFIKAIKKCKRDGRIVLGYFGSGSIGLPGLEKQLDLLIHAIAGDPDLINIFDIIIQGRISVNPFFKSAKSFFIFPPTSYPQAMAHMRLVDVGVNLFNVPPEYAPCVIAGKTYEYINSSVPIFAIAPKEAHSLREILHDTGGYFADINDKENVVNTLKSIAADMQIFDPEKWPRISPEKRFKYSREYQYKKLIRLISDDESR